jgi:hypothetical protein
MSNIDESTPQKFNLNERDKALLNKLQDRKAAQEQIIEFAAGPDKSLNVDIADGKPISNDVVDAGLLAATGSANRGFAVDLLRSLLNATATSNDQKLILDDANNLLSALTSMAPQDEIEGMLVSKLIALHKQSMVFMARTINPEQTTVGVDLNINRSTKLTRLYNETLQTLLRYRARGQQQVVVQHVHLTGQSQAVVNGVFQKEGGMNLKSGEVPYA